MMGICLMRSPFLAPSLPSHPYSISIIIAVHGAQRTGADLFWHVRDGYSIGKGENIQNSYQVGFHKNTTVQLQTVYCTAA